MRAEEFHSKIWAIARVSRDQANRFTVPTAIGLASEAALHGSVDDTNRRMIQKAKNADSRANEKRPVSPGLCARALFPTVPYGGASRPRGKASRAREKLQRLHANAGQLERFGNV